MGRPGLRLATRRVFWQAIVAGASTDAAAAAAGVSRPLGSRWFSDAGGMSPVELCEPSGRYLSAFERETIGLETAAGKGVREIARLIGRAPSTVSRELRRNCGVRRPRSYRPSLAQHKAEKRACRPKVSKLASNRRLHAVVQAKLNKRLSPEQIAAQLRREFPDDRSMHVSHEAIYRSLYVQGRGELRRELAKCLRTGRAIRRPRGRVERRGRIPGMVMISERPAEANDRAVPGHWEGDLLIGKDCKTAVGTLVERTSRYLLLLHLPGGRDAHLAGQAMRQAITALPAELARTITWDQGIEMARHADFTVATGIPVYFCDPHSPWQRGSNENTNGLLRQYLPKGTDLSVHSAGDLARIARSLNGRPRKTLEFMTPSEKLTELLAHTG